MTEPIIQRKYSYAEITEMRDKDLKRMMAQQVEKVRKAYGRKPTRQAAMRSCSDDDR